MKLSILDYVPIFENRNATDALNHSIELAQLAEKLGYERYWVAEHHQVLSVASSAPEMIMMALLEQTTHIRIGSGGIMIPHYSPYKVAEQFKIMEARHPQRVDLALGRSKSYPNVFAALNENKTQPLQFETQLNDLQKYFTEDVTQPHRFQTLIATPQINSYPEMFILGMSERSAKLAGRKGLPFVIAQMGQASHHLQAAIKTYKSTIYQHYGDRVKPYVILATFVVTGENLDKTNQLLNAFHLWLIRIFYANQPKSYPSIDTVINRQWTDRELKKKSSNANRVISGSPYQVATQLKQLKKEYHVDEIMIFPHVYGEANRKRLLELVMEYSKT